MEYVSAYFFVARGSKGMCVMFGWSVYMTPATVESFEMEQI